jgi:hypothetical protein
MAKKHKQRDERKVIKKQAPPPVDDQSKDTKSETEPEPENPFDFGGLPQRNLKKNLGCG